MQSDKKKGGTIALKQFSTQAGRGARNILNFSFYVQGLLGKYGTSQTNPNLSWEFKPPQTLIYPCERPDSTRDTGWCNLSSLLLTM